MNIRKNNWQEEKNKKNEIIDGYDGNGYLFLIDFQIQSMLISLQFMVLKILRSIKVKLSK